MNDSLGDRIKSYENRFTSDTFLPTLPVIIRLDGKSFHRWTKGLDRPFDTEFKIVMCDVTKQLIHETGAKVGYTQSDEITLILYHEDYKSQVYFQGKVFKINSICASMATAYFNYKVKESYKFQNKHLAFFDCRSFQVPNLWEAVNCLIWRELDATRNSILSVGQANFSHKEMQGLNCSEIQEKLFQEKGINWNNYPYYCKKGTYFGRSENGIQELKIPPLTKILNAPEVLFNNAKIILKESNQHEN